MVFGGLASFVTRRYKLIVAAWIIAAIILIPYGFKLESITTYEVKAPAHMESILAEDLIKESFANFPNGSLIIVVEADNVTSPHVTSLILKLNETLRTLDSVANVSSIYDFEKKMLKPLFSEDTLNALSEVRENITDLSEQLQDLYSIVENASQQLYDALDYVNETNQALYNLTELAENLTDALHEARKTIFDAYNSLKQLEDGVSGMSYVVYGIPSLYVKIWLQYNASLGQILPVTVINALANATLYNVTNNFQGNLLAKSFYDLFYIEWNKSFSLQPTLDPYVRAKNAIDSAALKMLVQIANPKTQFLFSTVWRSFNFNTWNSTWAIKQLTFKIASQGIPPAYRSTMREVYFKNGNPLVVKLCLVESFADAICEEYPDFNRSSVEQFLLDLYDLKENESVVPAVISFMKSQINETMAQDLEDYLNMTVEEFLWKVYELGENPPLTKMLSLVVNSSSNAIPEDDREQLEEHLNMTVEDFLWEVYSLGESPSPHDIQSFIVNFSSKALSEDECKDLEDIFNMTVEQLLWKIFSLGYPPNEVELENFVVDTLARAFQENFTSPFLEVNIASLKRHLHQLYKISTNDSQGVLHQLLEQTLLQETFHSYPITPSEDILNKFISKDHRILILNVDLKYDAKSYEARRATEQVRKLLATFDHNSEVKFYVTGTPAFNHDSSIEMKKDISKIDPTLIFMALVLVGLYFSSFTAPLLPVLIIGLAVLMAQGVLFFVGQIIPIYYATRLLVPVTSLGAGVDFSIFIMSRYLEERRKGVDKQGAVFTAIQWAGESVATSGGATISAFGALALSKLSSVSSIGLGVMLGIGMVLLASLTLTPSILMLLGDRCFIGAKIHRRPSVTPKPGRTTRYFAHAARITRRHAKAIIAVSLIIAVACSCVVATMETSNDIIAILPPSESKQAFEIASSYFPPGELFPTYVVAQLPAKIASPQGFNESALRQVEQFSKMLESIPGVVKVESPVQPYGKPINYTNPDEVTKKLMRSYLGKDNSTVLFQVILGYEPFSENALQTVKLIRERVGGFKEQLPLFKDAEVLVGGSSAGALDAKAFAWDEFLHLAAFVIIAIFIILSIVLNSILTPLRLIATIVFGVFWSLAITTLLFQKALGVPIFFLVPMILFIAMTGLGIDYDIFLVTRAREEVVKGKSDEDAISEALMHTGGIITACGVVMAGSLGSLMLSTSPMLYVMGFALALSVLFDTFIIRTYLVPAVMLVLKKYNWWAPWKLRKTTPLVEAIEQKEQSIAHQGSQSPKDYELHQL